MTTHFSYPHIAYLAGRLITNKEIVALYDYALGKEINVEYLFEKKYFKEIEEIEGIYVPAAGKIGRFRYPAGKNDFIELAIKGSTFIIHSRKNTVHYLGNVRGDSVNIFDPGESTHFNFRIIGSPS